MTRRQSKPRDRFESINAMFCWPGPRAKVRTEGNTLIVYVDPLIVMLSVPSVPGAAKATAGFLRELAHEASRVATAIDPAKPTRRTGGDQS